MPINIRVIPVSPQFVLIALNILTYQMYVCVCIPGYFVIIDIEAKIAIFQTCHLRSYFLS